MQKPPRSDPPRARRASKPRREQIIDTAARRLNRFGVTDNTLRDVAAELGLTRAALYYYIEDREDLVFQTYRRSCELLARGLETAMNAGGPALETIQAFVRQMLATDGPDAASLTELGLLREPDRATVMALYEGVVARLAGVLETGIRASQIRPCDPGVVARTIISMVQAAPTAEQLLVIPPNKSFLDRTAYVDCLAGILDRGWAVDRNKRLEVPPFDLDALAPKKVAGFDRDGLAEAKREQILITASRLFNRKGIDATTLDEIAGELGVTKRTLYQHVGDKQAILAACYERTVRVFEFVSAKERARLEQGQSMLDTYTTGLKTYAISWQREDLEPLRPRIGSSILEGRVRVINTSYIWRLWATWSETVEGLRREQALRPLNTDCLAMILPTAPAWLAKGLLQPSDPARQAAIAGEVVDVHRLGLAPL